MTLLLIALLALPAAAPENPRKYAVTDLEKVDDDYSTQGEYFGEVNVIGLGYGPAGLQVVARGDGEFSGRLLSGGLPGNGWDTYGSTKLHGYRGDERVVLRSRHSQIILEERYAYVYDQWGRYAGRLERMRRMSPTMGATPPPGGLLLFGREETNRMLRGEWTEQGWLLAGAKTELPIGDARIHLEFRTPYMPYAQGQARGNSGVYIQERYEVQILDSFGLKEEANQCGGLYRQRAPRINMCLPPLSWQTYDIFFQAARFDEQGRKLANARLTVVHNGITIHDDVELPGKTGNGKPEGPQPRPILLQDHGNPVYFRNFWIAPLPAPADCVESVPGAL